MTQRTFTIAGAGPAGLAAAIVLARAGHRVRVIEQHTTVGQRFNDDYQGLENWSRDQDALAEIRGLGIEPDWWGRPFNGGVLYDPALRPLEVEAPRPLFYLLRRGPMHPGSLDRALAHQAQSLGVDIVFGQRADLGRVDVVACGPVGRPVVVARGLTFKIDREDMASGILDNRLAPDGYVYFLVCEGQATLATVLFRNFRDADRCLTRSVAAVRRLFDLPEITGAAVWGGYGRFSIPRSCERDGALWVGEAAGFQDSLFGFGIRKALVSGALAARALIEGRSFDALWRARLLGHLKASAVNRAAYASLGTLAQRGLWTLTGRSRQPHRVLRRIYGLTPLHQVVYPLLNER